MIASTRRHAAALLGYVLLALCATWPLALHLDSAFTGAPSGDTGVYVWNLWVFQHELQQGRVPFYTSSILSLTPEAGPVNLSLHNYTTFANLIAWPLVSTVGLVAAFNLVFLLNIALSGFGAWLLARDLTGGRSPESFLAGVAFALSPVLVAKGAGHFSLVAAAPLPVFVLLLRRVASTGRLRYAVGLGVVVAWATFSDAYYGVFCLLMGGLTLATQLVWVERATDVPVPHVVGARRVVNVLLVIVGAFVLGILVRGGGPVQFLGIRFSMRTLYTPMLLLSLLVALRLVLWARPRLSFRPENWSFVTLRGVAAGLVMMAVLLAPVLVAFGERVATGNAQMPSTLWRSSPPGVDVLGLLLPNPTHPLWGAEVQALLADWSKRADAYPEAVGSLSLVALAVVAAAVMTGWRPSRIRMGFTIFFGLLALGPFLHVAGVNTQFPLPWAVLRYVPVLGMIRSPGRFSVLVTLGVAMLFAMALAHLARRPPAQRRRVLIVVTALLAFELWPAPRVLYSAAVPAIYQRIAADPRPDIRVLELPFGIRDGASSLGSFNARTQYFQTAHGKAIVGGYLSRVSARRKAFYQRLPVLNALMVLSEERRLGPEQARLARERAEAFLARANLGYVVIDHTRASSELTAFATELLGLTEVAREGPMVLYVPRPPSPPGH